MVPHRFSSSLSVENLVLPFVTVKAGLLSSPMEKQPRFYASGVQLAGRYRLAKKTGRLRVFVISKPRFCYGEVTVPLMVRDSPGKRYGEVTFVTISKPRRNATVCHVTVGGSSTGRTPGFGPGGWRFDPSPPSKPRWILHNCSCSGRV